MEIHTEEQFQFSLNFKAMVFKQYHPLSLLVDGVSESANT